MTTLSYAQPATLKEALVLRANGATTPLAGGTDVYPAMANGVQLQALLDVSQIEEFSRRIEPLPGAWLISPRITWADIAQAELPSQFSGLQDAAVEVGGRQIQNRGTIVGNICNASPAADGTVALMALDSCVRLASASGERTVRLIDFVVGNRKTDCRDDELVTGIEVPDWGVHAASAFAKLGSRRYLVISIAMAAVTLSAGRDGRIDRAAVAVGACGPKALRLSRVEDALIGTALEQAISPSITLWGMDDLTPIDDVRGSAAYRLAATPQLVAEAAERARHVLLETEI
jgi:CO/xanthine dehydrogenase FAD-binding subunit